MLKVTNKNENLYCKCEQIKVNEEKKFKIARDILRLSIIGGLNTKKSMVDLVQFVGNSLNG